MPVHLCTYLCGYDALIPFFCYHKDGLVHWIPWRAYRWYSAFWLFTKAGQRKKNVSWLLTSLTPKIYHEYGAVEQIAMKVWKGSAWDQVSHILCLSGYYAREVEVRNRESLPMLLPCPTWQWIPQSPRCNNHTQIPHKTFSTWTRRLISHWIPALFSFLKRVVVFTPSFFQ